LMVLNRDSAALFVNAGAPWKTVQELVREIRARPRELRASGTAKGGAWHLAFGGWLDASGLVPTSVLWIPTTGASPSLQELVAGGLDMACLSLPEARALLDGGRVRALAVMADERVAGFETVPTMRELGIDWTYDGWRALGVPKATPQPVVDRLLVALRRIVATDEFREFMETRGFGIAIEEGERLEASLRAADDKMGTLLTDERFTPMLVDDYGPWLYPGVLGAIVALVFGGLVASRARRIAERPRPLDRRATAWILTIIVSVAAWILLAPALGFIVTSALLLVTLLIALGNSALASLAVTIVLVPSIYWVFATLLGVTLPRGFLDW